ncbi:MAG: hypothetical protein A2Z25_06195 [Planctomycetes bacterium RBG_16_55_9]|nr:MAG: hypothetical protein A2Z25_06195 [Planctomycetes bacterium RBG_16_55_9]
MKFVLFVEGHTEKIAVPCFLQRWLNQRLSKNIGIKPVRFQGWPEMVKDMPKKAKMYLDRYEDIIAVFGLMDLYGPTFYPQDKRTTKERLDWATQNIEDKVGSDRFRIFFAVHEIEAWLMSDPNIFPIEIRKAFPSDIPPETINFSEPPSKLLDKMYYQKMGRKYKKVVLGRTLFAKLDPEIAYTKCPNLKMMLDEMLRMAEESRL